MSLWSLFRRQRARKVNQPRRAHLQLECLEERELMAAGLTASLSSGVLLVEGTEASDSIVIRQANQQIEVAGLSPVYATDQLNRIEIRGLGGNDVLDIRGVTIPGWLDTGAGADLLLLDSTSRVTLPGFTATDRVEFSDSQRVVKFAVAPDGRTYTLRSDGVLAINGDWANGWTGIQDFALGQDGSLYQLSGGWLGHLTPSGWQTVGTDVLKYQRAAYGAWWVLEKDGELRYDGQLGWTGVKLDSCRLG